MKIIIVTSSVTYCPDNYDPVLETILARGKDRVAGAVVIGIDPLGIAATIPWLYFAGARRMAKMLAKNLGKSISRPKGKLFEKYAVPVINAGNINDKQCVDSLTRMNADLIFNLRSRCIFDKTVLKLPRLGCVNLHHGLMPGQRGLFCDLWAIAEKRKTGFTIHKMTEKIDQGQIFYRREVEEGNDYIKYLKGVESLEGNAAADFIEIISRQGELPDGAVVDQSTPPIVTTTPSAKQIKNLLSQGMII